MQYSQRGAAKQPCAKDCPQRAAGCAVSCERWSEYVKAREKQYADRADISMIKGAICDGYRRMTRR